MPTKFIQRTTVCLAVLVAGLLPAHGADPDLVLKNAAAFVKGRQAANGSFGQAQPHLQTGLAMLALLSLQGTPDAETAAIVARGADYLLKTSSSAGALGDDVFHTESHAVACTALICAVEHIADPELRAEAAKRSWRAIRYLQRLQDRSSSSSSHGGWRMEGRKGRVNDRRASGWALLGYAAMRDYGLEVPMPNLERAARFMLGSFKNKAPNPDQIGGFSVDREGLAVDLASAMGGWVMARFDGPPASRAKNLDWLRRHPPGWTGPNYFYAAFFRMRALKFQPDGAELYRDTTRRLLVQLADHQQADGSIGFPPGNARNTLTMGPVFSTAMAILILNAENSRLPFDEVYRPQPLF